ncbi:transglycosylase SLT domain-containing protein [Dichelobacter nodosus]|nr:transglycosylase SLT domain-containing protein [Dichelobacter nodosus]
MMLFAGCAHRSPLSTQETVAEEKPRQLLTASDARFDFELQPPVYAQEDACILLEERPHWRLALQEAQTNWKVKPWFVLAFMHQESRFDPRALSKSMAYGYAQAKDDTWDWYMMKTGRYDSVRDRFDDAVDFMGFYVNRNRDRNHVAINDVKNQYLAYHEGMGGFESGSYLAKPWLLAVSDKVVNRAHMYREQLRRCPL